MPTSALFTAAWPVAVFLISLASAWISVALASPAHAQTPSAIERGRYLVQAAGYSDCHPSGYAEAAGKIDEKLWLACSALGGRGAPGLGLVGERAPAHVPPDRKPQLEIA